MIKYSTNLNKFSTLYLFAIATLLVGLSKRFGLGSILGLLIAGVIVGPYSPGPILTDKVEAVRHITEFGVVLLLFVIGLEMQPRKLWNMRKEVFGLGSAQIMFSGILIFIYSYFYAQSWQVALLVERIEKDYSSKLMLIVEYRDKERAKNFVKNTKPKRASTDDF